MRAYQECSRCDFQTIERCEQSILEPIQLGDELEVGVDTRTALFQLVKGFLV